MKPEAPATNTVSDISTFPKAFLGIIVTENRPHTSGTTIRTNNGKVVGMKTDSEPEKDYHEIACQQVLAEDHSVFSIQWVVIPGPASLQMTSDELLNLYLAYVERCTLAVVRPVVTANSLDFRLCGSAISLIKFALPRHTVIATGSTTTLCISGGILVQPRECDRGQLDFLVEQVADGTRISLQLSDYCPLLLGSDRPSPWRKTLYRMTQAFIHKVVTIRFLAGVYKQLCGGNSRTRVVKVVLRNGEET